MPIFLNRLFKKYRYNDYFLSFFYLYNKLNISVWSRQPIDVPTFHLGICNGKNVVEKQSKDSLLFTWRDRSQVRDWFVMSV